MFAVTESSRSENGKDTPSTTKTKDEISKEVGPGADDLNEGMDPEIITLPRPKKPTIVPVASTDNPRMKYHLLRTIDARSMS